MIRVESLTKSYGPNLAVDRLSFDVGDGEILGFLGPNGAGKTTTMRILTGFMPPGEGRVEIDGLDVARQSREVRRRIGYLPESVPIYREFPVIEYLDFVADLKGMARRGRRERLDRLMEQCGLTGVRGRIVGRLSRGYRQRVGLAQALVGDPSVLILDEPTVGLDPAQVVEVRELIRGLTGRRTVILSSHILPEVSQLCSRVLIINRGRIVAEGTPQELTSRLAGRPAARIRVQGPGEKARQLLAAVDGVLDVITEAAGAGETTLRAECRPGLDLRPAISRALVDGGESLLEISLVTMSLEEIFLSLVHEEPEPAAAGAARRTTAGPPPEAQS